MASFWRSVFYLVVNRELKMIEIVDNSTTKVIFHLIISNIIFH